jgi:hypothetical protein
VLDAIYYCCYYCVYAEIVFDQGNNAVVLYTESSECCVGCVIELSGLVQVVVVCHNDRFLGVLTAVCTQLAHTHTCMSHTAR